MKQPKLIDLIEPPEEANKQWFQKRGRTFELILNEMLSKEKMEPKTSMRPAGEEIDGSFAIENNFYLLEAKWHSNPIPASALYSFKGKVDGKLIGTIGVFLSMSDYSKDAVDALLNGKELNLILFGHQDLLLIEEGKVSFREAIRTKLRYAASYGQPFYPLETYVSNKEKTNKRVINEANEWGILVEDDSDVRTIQVLLDRFEISEKFKIIPAGGKLAVAQLAEYLSTTSSLKLAVIITPIDNPEELQKQSKKLNSINVEKIILRYDLEGWLEDYVSVDYYNATQMLTNRNGKMARRFARNADLNKLISENVSFSNLLNLLGAKPKSS